MTLMASPGPGNGWRHAILSGIPSSAATTRTSSLKRLRRGSTRSRSITSGRPPTLWWLLIRAASRVPLSITSLYKVPCTRKVASSSLPASSSKVRMNSSPMILRFASGSVTSASLSRKRPAASTWTSGTSEFWANASTTCLASLCLKRPWSTKTHVRLSPMALWTSIAPVGEPADGPCVAYLFSYPPDSVGNDVDRRPLGPAAAGLVEEVLEDLHPVLCMPDLGMELDPETPLLSVFERDNWNRGCLGGNLVAFRDGEDSVSVARPGLLLVGCAGEEALVALDDQVGATVLPDLDGPHLSALHERHELHSVTDAERRHAEVEEIRLHARSSLLIDTVGTSREDDALGVFGPYLFYGRVVWNHLRVDAAFPDAARDQLRVLPAEVEYQAQESSASPINSTATETFRSVHPRRCKRTRCQHRRS